MTLWKSLNKMSRQEMRDMQDRKLRHFITRHVYPFSPQYQKVFNENGIKPSDIRTKADLSRIPFTSKLDFIDPNRPDVVRDFILQPDAEKIRKHWPLPELLKLKLNGLINGDEAVKEGLGKEYRPIFITFTTGTTNRPVSFTYSQHDIQNLYTSGGRMLELFEVAPEEKLVNLFPFAPHLAVWQVVFGGLAANRMVLSTGGGKVMGTEGNIAALKKMNPTTILGVPSYVYHVLRNARDKGEQLPTIQKVVLGAARMTPAFKMKLADVLSDLGAKETKVFGTYGFTESRCAWAECPTNNDTSSGYHLYPDKEIFEIIDPKTGETLDDDADGEIVYTALDARASVVLRYRTGDYVRGGISWEACPHCGRNVPRLSSDITRLSDQKEMNFSKIKGCLVNFNNFAATFAEFKDIEEWQIELCKKDNDPFEIDQLVVYVCPKGQVDQAELAKKIKEELLISTEVSPNRIEFITMPEMVQRLELETASKEKRIVDNRPKT